MIGRDDKIVIPRVVGIDSEVLADETAPILLDFLNPQSSLFPGFLVFVFESVFDSRFEAGSDPDIEAFFGGKNVVGSPTDDDEIAFFGSVGKYSLEMVHIPNI